MKSEDRVSQGVRGICSRCRTRAVGEDGGEALVGSSKNRQTIERVNLGRPLTALQKKRSSYRTCKRISLGKFGMKKFDDSTSSLQQISIRPYTDRHMSPHDSLFSIAGCDVSTMVVDWFAELKPSVKEKVRKAGFEDFIIGLQAAVIDGPLIQALATKWWDTTHTFHFTHIGELTMTPMDFSAITGLAVSGIPLFLKRGIYRDKKVLQRLLGDAVCMSNMKRVPVHWLFQTYKTRQCISDEDEDIVARAFILALIGSTIFARPSMLVDLDWLGLMSDVSHIGRFNWGAAALAFLYNQMDDISRRNSFKIGGMWQAWEVWAREYLNIFPPIPPTTCLGVFPASKKWDLLRKPDADPRTRLEYYTIKLENIFVENMNWNPWGNASTFPSYVQASMDASKKRILLIGPNGSAWYLAERVLIQSFGNAGGYVPMDPPYSMMQARILSIRRTREAISGQCAYTFISNVHNYGHGFAHNAILEDRNNIGQFGHVCTEMREYEGVGYACTPEANATPSTVLLRRGSHAPESTEFELHTLDFPNHVKQIPVATAMKLLEVIGSLQVLLMESLKNADHKLRESATTIAAIQDELGLDNMPGTPAEGNKTARDSYTPM